MSEEEKEADDRRTEPEGSPQRPGEDNDDNVNCNWNIKVLVSGPTKYLNFM